jgi:hypothetical protein
LDRNLKEVMSRKKLGNVNFFGRKETTKIKGKNIFQVN